MSLEDNYRPARGTAGSLQNLWQTPSLGQGDLGSTNTHTRTHTHTHTYTHTHTHTHTHTISDPCSNGFWKTSLTTAVLRQG